MSFDGPTPPAFLPPPASLPPPAFLPPPASRTGGTAAVLFSMAIVATGVWIVAVTTVLALTGWLVAQTVTSTTPIWVGMGVINLVLVVIPAGLISLLAARFGKEQHGTRAASRAWTVAGVTGGVLSTLRGISESQNEVLLLVSAAVVAVMVLLWIANFRPRSRLAEVTARAPLTSVAMAGGLLVLLPWLWAGALGGLAETIAALLAASAFGWLAGSILTRGFFTGFDRSRWWLVLVGGSAAAVTLVPLAAGIGGGGVHLAELLVLPGLGFTAAALAGTGRMGRTPVAVLIGAGVLGPLAFVDPEETWVELLGTRDAAWWAFIAALISVAIALAVGTASGLLLTPRRHPSRPVAAAMALVVLAAGAAVYGLAGRPGLFGERLLVVMADQADLTGLDTIADRPARIQATYQRLVHHAEASQAPLRNALDGWGLHYTPYYLVNAVLVDGGPAVRRWLEGRSDVDRVLLDERLRPLPVSPPTEHGAEPAPGKDPQWNINTIRAPQVWSEFGDEGKGIVIGTSDAGVDADHPDLRGSWRGGDDSWFDPWNGTTTPTAHNGHGTHTIGTALGRNGIGVAPQAQWIGCVNLDRNLGSPSRYLDCLQFMLAPFPSGGDPWRDGRADRAPHILTNSWGCPPIEGCDATAFLPATAAFAAAGIYFVAAAGNAGPACRTVADPPAPYPDVLTVGASDGFGQVAEFSSRGPVAVRFAGEGGNVATKPDVLAPGVDILSAMPGGGYQRDSGTSMAAPHVAGMVALMWSARPSLIGNIGETTRILRDTATPMPATPGPAGGCGSSANISGSGQVDAYAAVQAARSVH